MIWFNCPNLSRHSRTSGRATGQMQVICGRRNFVHASAVPKLQRCDFERFAEVCRFKSIHRYSSLFMSLFMSSFHFWRMACFSWATETSWNGLSLKLCWSALHFLGHGWVRIQARYSAIQPNRIQPHFKVWTLHHLQSPEWWLAQGCCRFNIAQSSNNTSFPALTTTPWSKLAGADAYTLAWQWNRTKQRPSLQIQRFVLFVVQHNGTAFLHCRVETASHCDLGSRWIERYSAKMWKTSARNQLRQQNWNSILLKVHQSVFFDRRFHRCISVVSTQSPWINLFAAPSQLLQPDDKRIPSTNLDMIMIWYHALDRGVCFFLCNTVRIDPTSIVSIFYPPCVCILSGVIFDVTSWLVPEEMTECPYPRAYWPQETFISVLCYSRPTCPTCQTCACPRLFDNCSAPRSCSLWTNVSILSSFWFFLHQPQNMQEWYWIWSFGFVVVSCRIWFFDGLKSVLSLCEESCTPLSTAKRSKNPLKTGTCLECL